MMSEDVYGRCNAPEPTRKRVLILYDPHLGHVTAHARGFALREALGRQGWGAEYMDVRQSADDEVVARARDVDAVYLLKVASLRLVKRLKESGTTVVFDLADALWKEHHRVQGWRDLDAILALADSLTSDNRHVAEYGRRLHKTPAIVPMATQIEEFDARRDSLPVDRGDRVRIGWVGSQGTVGALARIEQVLQRLADRHPNLELRVLGADEHALPCIKGLSISALKTYTEADMIREVLQMDVGVHPVPIDLEDYIMRGGMKAFVYMSAGIPAVCQNAGECADVIRDGVTGMLAADEQEWFEKLDLLIRSPELRRRIGLQSVEAVRPNHSLEAVARSLADALDSVTRDRSLRKEEKTPCVASSGKPRILLIADVPNWIFSRHCAYLQRFLSDQFSFSVRCFGAPRFKEEDFDLIYPLEWNLVPSGWIRTPAKYVTGIRSHLLWPKRDFSEFVQFLSVHFQRVHVVSRRLYQIFSPVLTSATLLTHGVDASFFSPSTRADHSGRRVRIGWAGNRNSAANKGFHEIIEPLGHLDGVELIYCGYVDRHLSLDEMRSFYDSLDVYVCASDSEGNNNSLLEAAAMERAIVTTDTGTVPEYLTNGESAFIVAREHEQFVNAVRTLQNDPALRLRMGRKAREEIVKAWDWRLKAQEFRSFFQNALEQVDSRTAPVAH